MSFLNPALLASHAVTREPLCSFLSLAAIPLSVLVAMIMANAARAEMGVWPESRHAEFHSQFASVAIFTMGALMGTVMGLRAHLRRERWIWVRHVALVVNVLGVLIGAPFALVTWFLASIV